MVDLMMILPEYFRPVLEFKELMRTDGAELDNLENDIQKLRNNFYIQTADEKSIVLIEKQFSIVAKPGETIEYRRQLLLSKYNTIVPFSIGFLRDRLQELFGSDYTMQVGPEECTITISVTSSRYGAVDLLYDLLWDIVPAHIKIIANQQVNNYISGALTAAGIMSGTFVQTI